MIVIDAKMVSKNLTGKRFFYFHNKRYIGRVVKKSGNKTVSVEFLIKNKKKSFAKYPFNHRSFKRKHLCHDENNVCELGKRVLCLKIRPKSKRKHLCVIKILED